MKRLVADTGPVFHLHEADALHLFPLIGEVFLPPLVASELRSLVPSLPPAWAKIQPLPPASQQRALEWQRAGLLHGGEAEALALAFDLKPDWFLTDDAAARLVAESLKFETHGSIGVLLWTAARHLIPESEAKLLFANLENSPLWMSARVRSEARAALERIFH